MSLLLVIGIDPEMEGEFAEEFSGMVNCALYGVRPHPRTEFGIQNGSVFDSAGSLERTQFGELEADVEWSRAQALEKFIVECTDHEFNRDLLNLEDREAVILYDEFIVYHRTRSVVEFLSNQEKVRPEDHALLHVLDLEPGLGIYWIRQPMGLARIALEFIDESLAHAGLGRGTFLELSFEQQLAWTRSYQGRFTHFVDPLVRGIGRDMWGDLPDPIPA